MSKQIGGAKGGGQSTAGQTSRTPIIQADSVRSKAMVEIIEAWGWGKIQGFATPEDPLMSIKLDGMPIKSLDGTVNFPGVTVDYRLGTQDQAYIPGTMEDATGSPVGVDTLVDFAHSITRNINDSTTDAVRVIVTFASLMTQNAVNGDRTSVTVELKIEVRPTSSVGSVGAWTTVDLQGRGRVHDKIESPYQRAFTINLKAIDSLATIYDIRVSRVTPDPISNASIVEKSEFKWDSYVRLTYAKLRRPNIPHIRLLFDARYFSSIPVRSYDLKGLLVKVPPASVYDPIARTYTATDWNGDPMNMVMAWSRCPAWILYHILTTGGIGLGSEINRAYQDVWSIFTIAKRCDEKVPDGAGGQECRYSLDAQFMTQVSAHELINQIAGTFDAMPLWDGKSVYLTQDAPKVVSSLYSPANVLDGRFVYQGSARQTRYTAALIQYNDLTDQSRLATEYVEDFSAIDRYGYKPVTETAVGCTSRSQAHRRGKRLLITGRDEIDTVTFSVGLSGINNKPGDIIRIADPLKAKGKRLGGRLLTGSTTTVIKLDSPVILASNTAYTLAVVDSSGNVAIKPITTLAGTVSTVTVGSSFATAPEAEFEFIVYVQSAVARVFRILGIAENEDGQQGAYTISAIQYSESKFADIDSIADLTPLTVNPYQVTSVAPPSGIIVNDGVYTGIEGLIRYLDISWSASNDMLLRGYHLIYRHNGVVLFDSEVGRQTYRIINPLAGDYEIIVSSVAVTGRFSTSITVVYTLGELYPIESVSVTDLVLKGNTDTTFSGKQPEFIWDTDALAVLGFSTTFAAGAGGQSPWFRDFQIDIYNPDDVTVPAPIVRTEFVTESVYVYTFEKNLLDGGPHRRVKAVVRARDNYGRYSTGMSITVANPAPTAINPLSVSIFAGYKSLIVKYTRPADNDWLGVVAFVSTVSGFTPAPANRVFSGTDLSVVIPNLVVSTYFIRLAAYDAFGSENDYVLTQDEFTKAVGNLEPASLFTWIRYADTPTTGMANISTGKSYIGIAYNKTSMTESESYADYEWSKFTGAPGTDGSSCSISLSSSVVNRNSLNQLTPSISTATIYKSIGTTLSTYAGRLIIATSADGAAYTDVYTSAANETSKAYTIPTTAKTVRIRAYLAGGTTTLLDEEVITIVSDGVSGVDSFNNIVAVLSNENQTVVASQSGVVETFSATTTMSVYSGAVDDSVNWDFNAVYANVTATSAATLQTQVMTTMGVADSGTVTMTATRKSVRQVNVLSGSEVFEDNKGWYDAIALGASPSITTSPIPAPNGMLAAKKFTNYPGGTLFYRKVGITFPANLYSVGMYFYIPTQVGVNFWTTSYDFNDAEGTNSPAFYIFDKWVFVELAVTTLADRGFLDFNIAFNNSYLNASNVFHVWGAMCKVGAATGKYIPYLAPVSKVFTLSKSKAGTTGQIGLPGKDGFVFNPVIDADFAGAVLPTGFTFPGTVASSDFGTTTTLTNTVIDQNLFIYGDFIPSNSYLIIIRVKWVAGAWEGYLFYQNASHAISGAVNQCIPIAPPVFNEWTLITIDTRALSADYISGGNLSILRFDFIHAAGASVVLDYIMVGKYGIPSLSGIDIKTKLQEVINDPLITPLTFNADAFVINLNGVEKPPFILGNIAGAPALLLDASVSVTGSFSASQITSGKIAATEKLTIGNGSLLIDGGSTGDASIIVYKGSDTIVNRDMAILSSGDLSFMKYREGAYRTYKNVQRVVYGVAESGTTVTIDGWWDAQPIVQVSTYALTSYLKAYGAQDQSWQIRADNLREVASTTVGVITQQGLALIGSAETKNNTGYISNIGSSTGGKQAYADNTTTEDCYIEFKFDSKPCSIGFSIGASNPAVDTIKYVMTLEADSSLTMKANGVTLLAGGIFPLTLIWKIYRIGAEINFVRVSNGETSFRKAAIPVGEAISVDSYLGAGSAVSGINFWKRLPPAPSGKWQFDAVADLTLSNSSGNTVVTSQSGATTVNTWTSGESALIANTVSATVAVQFSSIQGTGTGTYGYYYRSVTWTIQGWNGSAWINLATKTRAVTAAEHGVSIVDTNAVNLTSTYTKIRAYFSAGNTNGTGYSLGSNTYTYAENTVSNNGASATAIISLGAGGGTATTAPVSVVAGAYTVPAGWEIYAVNYSIGSWRHTEGMSNTYEDGNGNTVNSNYSLTNTWGWSTSRLINDFIAYDTDFNYQVVKTGGGVSSGDISTSTYDQMYWKANVDAGYAYPYSVDASFTLYSPSALIKLRTINKNSAAAANNFTFSSYAWAVAGSTVLAKGSLNYIAIGN